VDDQIGRLSHTLRELGMVEDTIVLFSSDHGDMLGSQGLRLKRKPWEESIRIPGILRYPRSVKAGQRIGAHFSHVDFAPTLLSLCGVKPRDAMQGNDLANVILGRNRAAPDSAFFQIFGPYQGDGTDDGWRGIRTQKYMYARFREKPWVLYDLQADAYQMRNLAGERSAAGVQADLEKRLSRWMERTGDSWNYNWSHLVEDNGRLYRHKPFYTVDEYLKWAAEHPELAPL
jgi:arylsulfatase A-like enzyme